MTHQPSLLAAPGALHAPSIEGGSTKVHRAAPPARPRLRIDELFVSLRRTTPGGVRMELRPVGVVTAARALVLPAFDGWLDGAELVVRCSGVCEDPFSVALDVADSAGQAGSAPGPGARHGELSAVTFDELPLSEALPEGAPGSRAASPRRAFSFELTAPLRALPRDAAEPLVLGLAVRHPARTLPLVRLRLVPIAEPGPQIASLDLLDATDALLVDAPERRLFDLQNPEEGTWAGTGTWRLRLAVAWADAAPARYAVDLRPSQIAHRFQRSGGASDVVHEDPAQRAGGERPGGRWTSAELVLDTSHPDLGPVPEEGRDVPLDVSVAHALSFRELGEPAAAHACVCAWSADLPLRLRDPRPRLRQFQRLSAVGIDFGTTATVAALYHKGYRSLLRLGSAAQASAKPAENPTYLLIEDHERLWAEMARGDGGARFPDLVRVVRGSHAAYEAMADVPSAVVGELKTLPERILGLDQSPQLRDRERQRDFLLDEARVRVLIRAYAYLLGRAINRPGQDVYLHYYLTHPAKCDERARAILEQEIRAGLMLSIPEGIPAEAVTVSMSASEPEAFAAEVCPELAAHPALEPLLSRFGELRFAVFDFGGGTLDVACGRFRPATESEQEEFGSSAVIETIQAGGDDHLGGEYLTHELVWLTHQSARALPEMEREEVPMMRPETVPSDNLANKPHLYKRSLAARQNRVRFERELGLERVKFGPGERPRAAPLLSAARLDGSEVKVTSLGGDLAPLHEELKAHLAARIREGVKLMKGMFAIAPYGEGGNFVEQGVVILLAGNSSRSEFVGRALAEELGLPDLTIWRPDAAGAAGDGAFSQVVLYDMPARTERGVSIVGVTPKTAVSLGALKIANREVHLVRRTQGFSYFVGDLRGFPPKFKALVPMGMQAGDPDGSGASHVDFGRWDAKMPLRVCREYEAGKMTSSDPRLVLVPSGLPPGAAGRLRVCVVSPEEVQLRLDREGAEPLRVTLNLAKYMR